MVDGVNSQLVEDDARLRQICKIAKYRCEASPHLEVHKKAIVRRSGPREHCFDGRQEQGRDPMFQNGMFVTALVAIGLIRKGVFVERMENRRTR